MSKHVLSGDGVGEKYAVQVDVNHLEPLGIGHFVGGSVDADSGVSVAEVESSELGHNFINHSLNLCFVGNVALDREDFAAGCSSNLLSSLLSFG